MYSLSVAIIMFVYTSMNLQIISSEYSNEKYGGSDLLVRNGFRSPNLEFSLFEDILNVQLKDYIEDYATMNSNLFTYLKNS